MTVGRAKAIISYVWLIFGGTIFGLVLYLTLIGKFRFSPTNWDAGLSWPMMATILGRSRPYLGHRNIQNTTRYTALAPDRFKSFWRD